MALRASPTRPRGRWRQGLASTRKAPNRPCLWSQPASLHASTAAQKALLRTFHFNSRASSRGTDRMRVPFQLQIKLRGTDRMQSVPYQPQRHDLEGTARHSASPIPIPVCRVRLQIVHGNWLQPVAISPLVSEEILRFTSTLRTFRVSQSTDR